LIVETKHVPISREKINYNPISLQLKLNTHLIDVGLSTKIKSKFVIILNFNPQTLKLINIIIFIKFCVT